MGAILDFLAGRTRDWDALEKERRQRAAAREAREAVMEASRPRPRSVKYNAYCKICGANANCRKSTPGEAIQALQKWSGVSDGGCGRENHVPAIQEVED